MDFDDIIGQQAVKERLISAVVEDKLPHSLMLCGPEGNGGLALAVALAQYLLCTGRAGKPAEQGLFGMSEAVPPLRHACGHCLGCQMASTLEHPDLHFIFPVYRKLVKNSVSDDFLTIWRKWLLEAPYGGFPEWTAASRAENQRLIIFSEESDVISRKLSLKSNQGGWRVCIIWLPEKMHIACANKMLKLLEEPPSQTLFLLVSEHPEVMLETVRSRTQMVSVPPLSEAEITEALMTRYGVMEAEARRVAHSAAGNMAAALRAISASENTAELLELFIEIMRLCYGRKVKEMKQWSEKVTAMGREQQQRFLDYSLRLFRENFVHNLHLPSLCYMSEEEEAFASKFAPFINEQNIIPLARLFEQAYADIGQNANPKILFFDLALKMTVLLRRPKA